MPNTHICNVIHITPCILHTHHHKSSNHADYLCARTAVIVGATGNTTHAAAVYAYQFARDEDNVLRATVYCSITHKNPAADSKMGFSLAQTTSGADTVVLAGAPGENFVYAILLRPVAGKCSIMNVLAPMLADVSVNDAFGYSVAFVNQFAIIGAPEYRRYYKAEVDGLLFTTAFCLPGYIPRTSTVATGAQEYGYDTCKLCDPSQTSEGGRVDACTPCQVTIPKNAVLNYGCSFKCLDTFFGDKCLVCSQYNAGFYKPDNSHWKDGVAECNWECDGGFKLATYENGTDYCVQCTEKRLYDKWENVEWVVGSNKCDFRCKRGFFQDPEKPEDMKCVRCSKLTPADDAIPPPQYAQWMDGLDDCIWGPQIGYACSGRTPGSTCEPCASIPPNSRLTDTAPTYALSRCGYSCVDGFFGHPVFKDVCKRCPELMEQVIKAPLPKNGAWMNTDSLDTCTTDSWYCTKGMNRSNLTAYCCPPAGSIPNTNPNPTYYPCQYACDLSYKWNNDTASCDSCGFTKANSQWLLDCDYTCIPTFFGRDELNLCLPCNEYRTRVKTPVPFAGFFPVNSVSHTHARTHTHTHTMSTEPGSRRQCLSQASFLSIL